MRYGRADDLASDPRSPTDRRDDVEDASRPNESPPPASGTAGVVGVDVADIARLPMPGNAEFAVYLST